LGFGRQGDNVANRLLIIGWDGADWEILDDLMAKGVLPNVSAIVAGGARGDLHSTVPAHSWAAWSTFLTGLHPAGHGVYDFVERHPTEPMRRIPVGSGSIKAPTFPERLSDAGLEVRVANVPVTFPPIPVRGRMISGVAIPQGAPFVWPEDWGQELQRRAPFPINGMEWGRFQDQPDDLLDEVARLVRERTSSYEVLLEGDWSVATAVFVAPDRLQHPFGAYLLPTHPEYGRLSETATAARIRDIFSLLDQSIERLMAASGDGTTTVLMSDHGFRPITRLANMDAILAHLGFGTRSRTAQATTAMRRSGLARAIAGTRLGHSIKRRINAPSTLDWSKTRAYQSASGGGVSINLRGREPAGIVAPSEFERVRSELKDSLLSFRDPETGEAPVRKVTFREELPAGRYLDLASDLIVTPVPLWSFAHTDALSASTEWPSGSHRGVGVLAAIGGGTAAGDLGERSIADLPATILARFGLPASGLDGHPIEQLLDDAGSQGRRLAAQAVGGSKSFEERQAVQMTDEENAFVEQHLRDLGYIE
jgi:predicted AlkP superfamily phosphohydrolase/phosphomutase